MFRRVLVANRGEVAVRVIRALHESDIEAVAVYSTADERSLHVRLADRTAVMEGGRVHQFGTRSEILERPADDFVREFTSGNLP